MTHVTSKTSALRSLLLRAWRERWSDIQWGIHLKSVLPRGCSGDAYNLSNLILQQALVGPVPNPLVLSYLRHSLAAQTVSYAALLEAIYCFGHDGSPPSLAASGNEGNPVATPTIRRPHCVAALLELIELSQTCMTSRGKPEECVSLATSTLKVTLWLLKCMTSAFELGDKVSAIEVQNFTLALELIRNYLDSEFSMCLLFLGKAEDKDTHDKILAASQQLLEFSKTANTLIPESTELKQDIMKTIASVGNLDPMRSPPEVTSLPSFVHAIQPMLLFEALLRPTSDQGSLSHHLHSVATMHNISFTDLVFDVLRCLLLTISQKQGFESLKVDSFISVSLPILLEKLYKLMKNDSGSINVASAPLKTPTDLYKVFDKLLACDALLNSVDLRGKCNIIDNLIKIIRKCPVPLMTDTEKDDVLKKREKQKSESKLTSSLEEIVGSVRNFDMTLKAENTLDLVLQAFDVDFFKTESVETLLGVLYRIIREESFDRFLGPASSDGRLRLFIKKIVKCNQHSQESQGESVKNSLLRATLFDVSFLMLVHIVHCFGSEIVLSEAQGSFIETWICDMMIESECRVKSFQAISIGDNIVDNLLQQLGNGDLRTQVVKWQNVCINIHQAVKEMVIARSLKHLSEEDFKKMLTTLCSRLCALPVCVVNFLASWRLSMPANSPIDIKSVVQEFMEVVEKVAEEKLEIVQNSSGAPPITSNDLLYTKERIGMMTGILQRMLSQTGLSTKKSRSSQDAANFYDPKSSDILLPLEMNKPLKEVLIQVWKSVGQRGWLDIESMWRLHSLLKTGGPNWFTSCLVEDLLSVVYQTDIDKLTELLLAIFYVDIEQCTLALLLHVIPGYLQYRNKRERLTDPHGTALAKLTVGCIYIVLMGVHAQTLSKHASQSKKRRADEMSDEVTSAKMRRLVGLSNENSSSASSTQVTTFASSYDDYLSGLTQSRQTGSPSEVSGKADELASHPVTQAVSGFFRLLHNVVSCQEIPITPCTHFTFRFLEQTALRGGRHQNAKSRLVFQHMSTSLVIHLVKIVPHLFSMGILSKLFDISTVGGRKNMARVMCLLRNILASKKNRDLEIENAITPNLTQKQG